MHINYDQKSKQAENYNFVKVEFLVEQFSCDGLQQIVVFFSCFISFLTNADSALTFFESTFFHPRTVAEDNIKVHHLQAISPISPSCLSITPGVTVRVSNYIYQYIFTQSLPSSCVWYTVPPLFSRMLLEEDQRWTAWRFSTLILQYVYRCLSKECQ